MSEPTLGEVLWRLNDVANQLTKLAVELKADREAAALIYVRKDVYSEWREAMAHRVKDLEDEQEKSDSFRRQIIVGLILAAASAVISLVLTVSRLL